VGNLVADDGSRDRTPDIVAAEAEGDARIRLLQLPHHGKGEAVRRGLIEARGEWRYIADADLATPPDNLTRFLAYTSDAETALVIGSREAPGSRRHDEPWIRHWIGRFFNWFVRLLVVPGINDTQCGFKLFSARAVELICPHLTIQGFAFDVEMLALARRAGLSIREVGVTWDGNQESRVAFSGGAAAFLDVSASGGVCGAAPTRRSLARRSQERSDRSIQRANLGIRSGADVRRRARLRPPPHAGAGLRLARRDAGRAAIDVDRRYFLGGGVQTPPTSGRFASFKSRSSSTPHRATTGLPSGAPMP
jgi:dolichyl-phosphate beta-glucosyltransferase